MLWEKIHLRKKTRELANICGWIIWEECTTHGVRTLVVTIRHNSKGINLINKPIINDYCHAGPSSIRRIFIIVKKLCWLYLTDFYNWRRLWKFICYSSFNWWRDVSEILSITPVDTELSVLKRHMEELKKDNELLPTHLNRNNYCIIMWIQFLFNHIYLHNNLFLYGIIYDHILLFEYIYLYTLRYLML